MKNDKKEGRNTMIVQGEFMRNVMVLFVRSEGGGKATGR